MGILRPSSSEELAQVLAAASAEKKVMQLGGAFSKNAMAGPIAPADCTISTTRLDRVLQYEPRDLTISVEAGMPWSELTALLAENQQMVPLDPAFSRSATVGGVVASNSSGPRRRLYGTARDVVIGMKFATLAGKLVQSGGMVVKNVAGLDMAKLMIGSFGTLAAIATVNFKLAPMPVETKTLLLQFMSLEEALAVRDRVLRGVLQPAALDLLNPAAAARIELKTWCLLVQAGGSPAVLKRYQQEFPGAIELTGPAEDYLWTRIREFAPEFLAEHPDGAVARLSTTLGGVADVMRTADTPALARAATGVVYLYFADAAAASVSGHKGVIEFAPETLKPKLALWPAPGNDFRMMERVKLLFDPHRLLNPGRMYGRI